MRLIRFAICISIACAFATSVAMAGVVTVDFPTKDAKCDTPALEVKGVKVKGEQIGFLVQSNTLTPQTAKLRCTGLAAGDYDLYVDESFIGTKSAAVLESGIDLPLAGRVVDPIEFAAIEAAKPKIEAAHKKLQGSKDEAGRVCYTMGLAKDWVNSAIRIEASYRSAVVLVAPSGKMLEKMPWRTKMDTLRTVMGVHSTCCSLQEARNRMYTVIEDKQIKNDAVAAMTPIDIKASYSIIKGKPSVGVKIINNCNFSVNGNVHLNLPAGWKAGVKTAVNDIEPGKSASLFIPLARVKKDIAAPKSVHVTAVMKLWYNNAYAQVNLFAEPKRPVK